MVNVIAEPPVVQPQTVKFTGVAESATQVPPIALILVPAVNVGAVAPPLV